jgi:hypothetical protein
VRVGQHILSAIHHALQHLHNRNVAERRRYSTQISADYGIYSGSSRNAHEHFHTPKITNTLGAASLTSSGQGQCPACQINFSNVVTDDPDIGYLIDEDTTFSVICTLAGTFFNVSFFTKFEIAATLTHNTGGKAYQWTVTPYCTPATTPPDYAPNYSPDSTSSPYWLQKAICKNNSGMPNGVFCFPTTFSEKPAPQNRYACTKNLQ